MLLVFAAGIALTLAYLSLAPRMFSSEAKILVRLGRENVALDPTATTGQFVAAANMRGTEVFAVEELLASRPIAEKIVDQFGPSVILERDTSPDREPTLADRLSWLNEYNLNPLRVYSIRDRAIREFGERLNISAGKQTSVISLSYECDDPKVAQNILSSVIPLACEEHLQVHRTRGSQKFFASQCEQMQADLAKLEQKARDLKNSTGVASLEVQRKIQLELIGTLQGELVRARTEQDALSAELRRRNEQLKDAPAMIVSEETTGLPQTSGEVLRQKLYDLEVREKEEAAKYTAEHPALRQIREQIVEARRIAENEKMLVQRKTALNEKRNTAELAAQERDAELAALGARTKSLETKIALIEDRVKQLNDAELEINRLDREVGLARDNVRKYSENLEQARIDQELEEAKISSLNLLQPATFSETPVSPRPLPTLAIGFVLSTMGSLAVALMASRRRPAVALPKPAAQTATTPEPHATPTHLTPPIPAT